MFDAPIDSWYVWIGVAIASLALAGVGFSVQSAPGPDTASVANTVDRTAGSPHEATGRHPIQADKVRLGTHRIGLEQAGSRAYATFRYGPVTPVERGTQLWRVLDGAPPERVFDSPAAFRTAIEDARNHDPQWKPANDCLIVRTVSWEGTDVTLVGV